jgi:hypothetical protein
MVLAIFSGGLVMETLDSVPTLDRSQLNTATEAIRETEFRPVRTAKESVAMMTSAEALNSDFSTVRKCGSWRS